MASTAAKSQPWGAISFRRIYWTMAVVLLGTASSPTVALWREFHDVNGNNHFWPIVTTYPGFFLFPIPFLIVILIVLYVPTCEYFKLVQQELKLPTRRERYVSLMLVPFLAILTAGSTWYEVTNPSLAIFEIDPRANGQFSEVTTYDKEGLFKCYFCGGPIVSCKEKDRSSVACKSPVVEKPWVKDPTKSWPDIFEYLLAAGAAVKKVKQEQSTQNPKELVGVPLQKFENQWQADMEIFSNFLSYKRLVAGELSPSKTRPYYKAGFAAIFFVGLWCLGFTALFGVRKLRFGDAAPSYMAVFWGLSLALLCFVCWIPMRIRTWVAKGYLYSDHYPASELLVSLLFLFAVIFLSFAWWYRQREKIEFTTSAVGIFIGVASYFSQDSLFEIFSAPRFYVAFALVCCIPLAAAWYFTILRGDNHQAPAVRPDKDRRQPATSGDHGEDDLG